MITLIILTNALLLTSYLCAMCQAALGTSGSQQHIHMALKHSVAASQRSLAQTHYLDNPDHPNNPSPDRHLDDPLDNPAHKSQFGSDHLPEEKAFLMLHSSSHRLNKQTSNKPNNPPNNPSDHLHNPKSGSALNIPTPPSTLMTLGLDVKRVKGSEKYLELEKENEELKHVSEDMKHRYEELVVKMELVLHDNTGMYIYIYV